jgi:hypothetical protein
VDASRDQPIQSTEDAKVNQIPRKVSILIGFLRGSFNEWRTEVWRRDLDEQYCCSGRECGCGGATVEEVFGAVK